MARKVKYSDTKILNAAAQVVAASGVDGASVSQVAKRVGAPSGSVYHRYPSRKHLLGALWVRTLTSFYDGLDEATRDPGADHLPQRCVDAVFDWTIGDPLAATLLEKFRTEDLIENDWPAEVRVSIASQNQRLADLTNRVAEARTINPLDAILGVLDIPVAAARRAHDFDNDVVTGALRDRAVQLARQLLN
ncbi:MAG: TetR/AcrR family transcriptional regulator [Acidimicrobiales bacterium]|nr:TetR/AcrR family transcriptional regulator [Acidimicrobiales bacterium]